MKHSFSILHLIVIFQILFSVCAFSQCIIGDCNNGSGTYIFSEKEKAEGSWKNGKLNGKCKYFFKSGATYDGEMIDGKFSGIGKYVYSNGGYYEGSYKAGLHHGPGKSFSATGYSEEGKYINDTLNGYANLQFSSGDKYVGYVINALPNGNGISYYVGGDKFEGSYKNGKPNGNGTFYYAKGGTLKGIWVDGKYVSGSNKLIAENNSNMITPLLSSQNVYEVNVMLNNVLKLDMIFDTGAAEVYFTPDIVMTLIKTKTISEDDLLEGAYFIDANGNVNKSIRFNLKSIKIGDITLKDIPCAVSNNIDGMNLLGLSALKKLGKFEFDFIDTIIRIK
jgi:hypothetical protein